jgi:hypothetical protein
MEWRTKPSLMMESVTAEVKVQKERDHISDKQGVLNKEFLPERKTLRCEFYIMVLECLLKQISRVR